MSKRLCQSMLAFVLVASASAPAFAQAYLGVGFGPNFYRDAASWEIEDESTAFEIKAGVRLIDVLAVEMSYLNLGEFRDLAYDVDIGYSGVTFSGKAILPIGDQMDVYAKIGMYFWELDEKVGRANYLIDQGEDLVYGGGVAFRLTPQLSIDLEYRALQMVDLESDLLTAGITFSF